jgi:hypothetical protein
MSEHRPHDPQQTPQVQPAPVAASGVSKTRRNLLRAGAIGTPALVALKPASVSATTCKLPSGFTVSGNLSRGPKNCAQPGLKASDWRSATYCNTTSPFAYKYGTSTFTINKNTTVTSLGLSLGSDTAATTVDSWLAKGDTSERGLLMACYLQAVHSGNDSNWPAKQRFVDMWNLGVLGAGYTPPNQTVAWTKAKVIAYLMYLTNQVV